MNRSERVIKVQGLEEARRVAQERGLRVLILDLENTLVPYGPSRSGKELDAQIDLEYFRDCKTLVVSNARWTQAVQAIGQTPVMGRARKPFTRIARLHAAIGAPEIDAVIGDQFLTDGLLARRLGAVYIESPLSTQDEPAWPRMMRRLGQWLRPLA